MAATHARASNTGNGCAEVCRDLDRQADKKKTLWMVLNCLAASNIRGNAGRMTLVARHDAFRNLCQ
ncbi:hypothetical protein N9018_04775 [Rhodopirellula sp.]|nr:hypothetical protein [Rhodopirellula sp.]